jgi:hypothetical protein
MMTLALLLCSAAQDAEYFPLKTGSDWTYALSNGQSLTIRVTGAAAVKGVDCSVVESDLGPQKTREWLAVTPEGVKSFKMENASGALEFPQPVLRAKFPLRKGDTWKVMLQEGPALNTYQYSCDGTETLNILGATVEAVKVTATLQTPQGAMRMSAWYARGLGLVKQAFTLGAQTMTAELSKTNVKPAQAAPAPAAGGIRCPKCGAATRGKFCNECGTSLPAPPSAGTEADVVRYESKDGKVLLYHPKGWKVAEGAMFGEGTYGVTVDAPDENAGVLFLTFALNDQIRDSVVLASRVLGNLAKTYPTLRVSDMTSTQDRARTTAAVTFMQGAKKAAGRLYFFHTNRAGTVYALLAREDLLGSMRPTLTSIVANLAYAPEGVANVLQQGQKQAAQGSTPADGKVLHPAVLLKEALARGGKPLELAPVVAQDGSFSMSVPKGWTFQGLGLAWVTNSDARALQGACSVWHTVYTPGSGLAKFAQNAMQSQFLPPPQAMAFITRAQNTARNLRVLSACPETDIDPNSDATWAQAKAQGSHVDNRVLLVEFENVATGQTCRGIFTVACVSYPMGISWSCAIGGSWAPSGEFEELVPTFAAIHGSTKQNEQWVQGKFAAQAAESKRLNNNLMNSIKDLSKSYDRYNQSWWDRQKSQDYTSWAWSQTTLGQGSWVSEREGAEVVRSSSWGLENRQTGEQTSAVNHTNFTGRNPWTGEQLNEVNTRADYEKYIRGR